MNRICISIFIVAVSGCSLLQKSLHIPKGVISKPKQNLKNSRYSKIVQNAIDDPSSIDYQEVRQEYRKTSLFHPYHVPEPLQKLRELIEAKKYQESIAIVQRSMYAYFPEIELHYYAAIAYESKAMGEYAAWHRFVMSNLIDSVLQKKQGTTLEEAIEVISEREEYVVLNFFELENQSQKFLQKKQHAYDCFRVQPSSRYTSGKIFFQIDQLLAWQKDN
ncbi:MAG: DUF4919 domain-containing protein [Spirochaetota bacterium]